MQGLQRPVYGKVDPASGEAPVESLEIAQPGTQGKAQFDQTVRDITAFLEYAGEPAALKRQSLGVWVILFLAFFTFLADRKRGVSGQGVSERLDPGGLVIIIKKNRSQKKNT